MWNHISKKLLRFVAIYIKYYNYIISMEIEVEGPTHI